MNLNSEDTAISVRDLKISDKKGNILLNNINFKIKKSEIVGIVGESGSGKTLSMKSILGIIPKTLNYTYKELTIFENNIYDMELEDRRKFIGSKVGFIPQNTIQYLHPLIKIRNQIIDGYLEHKFGNKKEGIVEATKILKHVGIEQPEKVLNSLPSELSGGMRQRVNIAMAMICSPEIIIADEPTTALDVEIGYNVMELLKEYHENTNNTTIIISHDLSIIKKYCNRVIVMYNGDILEDNSTSEIFKNPQSSYTKALISLILSLDSNPELPLKNIHDIMK